MTLCGLQVKETVFSTFRGRHILHHLRKLRHVASSPAGRRRLSGLFVTEGSTDFLSELDESLGSECFTKDIPYRWGGKPMRSLRDSTPPPWRATRIPGIQVRVFEQTWELTACIWVPAPPLPYVNDRH